MGELTETWVPVAGYEGHYEVSSLGRVKSLVRNRLGKGGVLTRVRERILRPTKAHRYPLVNLSKDAVRRSVHLHRLVAKAFVPNPQGAPEVNHIDGNRSNNAASNLEWATRQENVDHACRTGLMPSGAAHWRSSHGRS